MPSVVRCAQCVGCPARHSAHPPHAALMSPTTRWPTVVSRPTTDRGILDAGSKTFSSDTMGLKGHGLILEYPETHCYAMSEEHGHVDFSPCPRKPDIGERLTVIPNHCCPVSNLFNEIVGVRQRNVEVVWSVAARGKLQ